MMNNANHEQRKRRAWNFYKGVLKWLNKQGNQSKGSRQAAIGLSVAMKSEKGREHVRQFLLSALKDGTPPEVLLQLSDELEREMKRKDELFSGK